MSKGILYIVYNDWIRDPQTGNKPYKIGKTGTSVSDRYYGLGLKMPGKFETLFAYKLDNYEEAEKAIQAILRKHCVNGEWFDITQDEINLVENICKTMCGTFVTDDVKQEIEIETEEDDDDNNNDFPYPALGKDRTQYSFNGRTYGKGRLVLAVVEEYIKKHNNSTLAELKKVFPKELQKSFFVVDTLSNAKKIIEKSPVRKKRHFVNDPIRLNNGEEVVVTTEWGISNIDRFIAKARELGFSIEICK
jgi:hypothetical protein